MRTIVMLCVLVACGGPGDTDEPAGVDTDVGNTDTDTDTDTHTQRIDLTGRWIVPFGDVLPGQTDRLWCVDDELGDYNDETWLELGTPVECYEGTPSGCANDLEFLDDGTVRRHVRYAADGPCPYDGITRSVIAWEGWGAWSFEGNSDDADVFMVNGIEWVVRPLGDGSTIVVEGGGASFSLSPGIGPWFQK